MHQPVCHSTGLEETRWPDSWGQLSCPEAAKQAFLAQYGDLVWPQACPPAGSSVRAMASSSSSCHPSLWMLLPLITWPTGALPSAGSHPGTSLTHTDWSLGGPHRHHAPQATQRGLFFQVLGGSHRRPEGSAFLGLLEEWPRTRTVACRLVPAAEPLRAEAPCGAGYRWHRMAAQEGREGSAALASPQLRPEPCPQPPLPFSLANSTYSSPVIPPGHQAGLGVTASEVMASEALCGCAAFDSRQSQRVSARRHQSTRLCRLVPLPERAAPPQPC